MHLTLNLSQYAAIQLDVAQLTTLYLLLKQYGQQRLDRDRNLASSYKEKRNRRPCGTCNSELSKSRRVGEPETEIGDSSSHLATSPQSNVSVSEVI
jgi:hypothetical protein